MAFEKTGERTFGMEFRVTVDAEAFPVLHHLLCDSDEMRKLISDNLERTVAEYLAAAEEQIRKKTESES